MTVLEFSSLALCLTNNTAELRHHRQSQNNNSSTFRPTFPVTVGCFDFFLHQLTDPTPAFWGQGFPWDDKYKDDLKDLPLEGLSLEQLKAFAFTVMPKMSKGLGAVFRIRVSKICNTSYAGTESIKQLNARL